MFKIGLLEGLWRKGQEPRGLVNFWFEMLGTECLRSPQLVYFVLPVRDQKSRGRISDIPLL